MTKENFQSVEQLLDNAKPNIRTSSKTIENIVRLASTTASFFENGALPYNANYVDTASRLYETQVRLGVLASYLDAEGVNEDIVESTIADGNKVFNKFKNSLPNQVVADIEANVSDFRVKLEQARLDTLAEAEERAKERVELSSAEQAAERLEQAGYELNLSGDKNG